MDPKDFEIEKEHSFVKNDIVLWVSSGKTEHYLGVVTTSYPLTITWWNVLGSYLIGSKRYDYPEQLELIGSLNALDLSL